MNDPNLITAIESVATNIEKVGLVLSFVGLCILAALISLNFGIGKAR